MQEFDIMNNKAKLLLLNMNQYLFGERSALTEALKVLLPVLLETSCHTNQATNRQTSGFIGN